MFHEAFEMVDVNNDAFISKDEYELLTEILSLHVQDWCGKT